MSRNPADRRFGKIQFWRARTDAAAAGSAARRRSRLLGLIVEACEIRELMTLPPTLTIPLMPDLDQFGDQILIVQGFDDPARAALGIFDTGASAVTFAAQDQEIFGMGDVGQIPIKVPGGAAAEGIGGAIIGDVSEPGTIFSDGMHAFNLTFDDIGFPQFNITLSDSAIETPGIQTFVGTEDSPLLPTITGTPALLPSPKYVNGAAAHIKMQGASLDFSDLMPGMIIPFPDLVFANPGDSIVYDPNNADIYETVTLPFVTFGGNNSDDPGDLITETELYLIPNITATFDTVTTTPGSFLFDTGAQLSVISTDMATRLGLDLSNPTTTIDVQGVAGNETIPGYTLKSLDVQRADGGTLQFTDVPVYVLDVAPGIDGIFGMNLLNLANEFVFDPYNASGPQLTIAFFANPDRSAPVDDGSGELAALLSVVGLNVLGGAMGGSHYMPSFASPKAESTTTLTVSNSTLEYGAPWSINTTVGFPTGAATPTGKVDLKSNGQVFASPALNAQGKATWNATGTPWEVGNYSVTAAYAGDAKYNSSVSTATNIQIVKATTSLSMQPAGTSLNLGQALNISGKLVSSTGAATGNSTIELKLDGTVVKTATTAADGSYSFSLSGLGLGSHTIQAGFAGSSHFAAVSSNSASIQVTSSLITTLAASSPTLEYGASLALTASVGDGSITPLPSGSVEFRNNGAALGTETLNSLGKASWNSAGSPWEVGSYSLTAAYSGNSVYNASVSSAINIQIIKAATSLTAQVSSLNTTYAQVLTISGKLTSSTGAATAGNTVQLQVDGSVSASTTISADGSYSFSNNNLKAGTHSVKVLFPGSSHFNAASSGTFSVAVGKASSALTLSAPATAPFGQSVPVTASVASPGYEGQQVSFFDGKKFLGKVAILAGKAVFPYAASKVGLAPKFTAKVEGSENSLAAASGTVSLKVVKAATSLLYSLTSSTPGSNSWSFQVLPVSPGAGTPTGQIKITLGGSKPKTITAKLSGGRYTYTVAGAAPVIKKISYVGDSNFSATSRDNLS